MNLEQMQAEMRARMTGAVANSRGSKCSHDIYWPSADPLNYYCRLCNLDWPNIGLRATCTETGLKPKCKSKTKPLRSTDNGQAN